MCPHTRSLCSAIIYCGTKRYKDSHIFLWSQGYLSRKKCCNKYSQKRLLRAFFYILHHIFPLELIPEFAVILAHSDPGDNGDFCDVWIFFPYDLFGMGDESSAESHMLTTPIGFFSDSQLITESMKFTNNCKWFRFSE